jgi:choline dehydrogenase-like flavoprotein
MIEDARTLPDQQAIEADVGIIGAGPAGITLARELAGRGLQICLLESGGFELERATQGLNEGVNTGHAYYPLDVTRLRYFGGTSNHWGGMSAPLSPLDFAARDWIPYSGWPFGRDALEPYYQQAQQICDLGPFDYDPARWREVAGTSALPLGGDAFFAAIAQYSPPTRFGPKYKEQLSQAPDVRVLLHANVLELVTNAEASRVEAVRVATLTGKSFIGRMRSYVLATGGLENPRLLLLSNAAQPAGLGNAHDLTGRFFMEHPGCACGTFLPSDPHLDLRLYDREFVRRPGVRARAFLALSEPMQRRHRLPDAAVFLTPTYRQSEGLAALKALLGRQRATDPDASFMDHLATVVSDLDGIGGEAYRRLLGGTKAIQVAEVYVNWEQAPDPASRVSLIDARDAFGQNRIALNWVVPSSGKDTVLKVLDLLAAELGRSGLGRLRILPDADAWFAATDGNHHHLGTTRMDPDPTRGVVDADCRVHGVDNLFVAGSSVFPTAGYINPTLTLVALTLRLAGHLKSRLGVSP